MALTKVKATGKAWVLWAEELEYWLAPRSELLTEKVLALP